MQEKSLKILVSAEIGKVSGRCFIPSAPQCVLSLAHGSGAGMNHSFMETLASRLAEQGIATLVSIFLLQKMKKEDPIHHPLLTKQLKRLLQRRANCFRSSSYLLRANRSAQE